MGSDVGSNWNEVVGEWGIEGFTLTEKYNTLIGTADAIIICTAQQPLYSAGEQYLSIDVLDPQTGDKYYLYPCCPSISTTSLVVEFECTNAPAYWTVRVGSVSKNFVVTTDAFGAVRIGACVDGTHGMVRAEVLYGPQEYLWAESVSPGTGRYSGLGHDNTGHQNVFDNYAVGELRQEDGTICNECFCRCLDNALPKKLSLYVVDATGRYDCFAGYTCDLDWEWNAGESRWKGEFTVVNGSKSQTMKWCLKCEFSENANDPANPGKNLSLFLCEQTGCCTEWPDGCLTVWEPNTGSTCQPLDLVFGPMNTSLNELQCSVCYDPWVGPGDPPEGYPYNGSMKIEITE